MSTSLNDKMKSAKSGNRNPCWRNSRESWFYFHFHFFFFFFTFYNKETLWLETKPVPFRIHHHCMASFFLLYQALSSFRRKFIFSFRFIFSFSASGFLNFRSRDLRRGRSLIFHVIKIIMLRQQTNHIVQCDHCCCSEGRNWKRFWPVGPAKMSSPSPGKRRMDTDVIKLYPCKSLCVI